MRICENLSLSDKLEILTDAEDDVRNGRVAPITDTFDALRAMLQVG